MVFNEEHHDISLRETQNNGFFMGFSGVFVHSARVFDGWFCYHCIALDRRRQTE